jgi:hypothetical protein
MNTHDIIKKRTFIAKDWNSLDEVTIRGIFDYLSTK